MAAEAEAGGKMAKPQLKSKTWNLISIIGSVVLIVIGFGGLYLLQSAKSSATTVLLVIVAFGIVTFVLFAGPGIAFVARKRIPVLKKKLPGDSLAWIRAHLYMPILALVAAWVHAGLAPFRADFSSGKVLLTIGFLVCLCGVARHHLIGVAKSAVNADAQISRLAAGKGRDFRQLVIDYKQVRRPLADIQADVAMLSGPDQQAWSKVVDIQTKVDGDFPRGGGQSPKVRLLKLARAAHAPLTILLFGVMAFHIFDVLGATHAVFAGDAKNAAPTVSQCADCHTSIAKDFRQSSMAHSQTGTIMEAQLPVTLAHNEQLAQDPAISKRLGYDQQAVNDAAAPTCINCHAPVGSKFVGNNPEAVLPLNQAVAGSKPAVSGGNAAVQSDGVSCIVCHSQATAEPELAGAGGFDIKTSNGASYGTVYGPLFTDPNPLPVRVHDVASGDKGFWNDPIATSIACGACHNVKIDLNGNGLVKDGGDPNSQDVSNDDFTLVQNELDTNKDNKLQDLVLQTTFDEWQDYVASFAARTLPQNGKVTQPLGCIDCHMPSTPGKKAPVVDKGPGFIAPADRVARSHTFVGVDYDLDPQSYVDQGLDASAVNDVIAQTQALIESAVTLQVDDDGKVTGPIYNANVTVKANLLGHSFPTGFAFARQFWIEVSATDKDGNDVCLQPIFGNVKSPCQSGVIDSPQALLPQCDPQSVATALGTSLDKVANGNIVFAAALPVGQCDPYLANFQKILTDGDPTGDADGVSFKEVTYQSFLPDIVKTRQRVVDKLPMAPLQPTRRVKDAKTGQFVDADSIVIPYQFDTSAVDPGTSIKVTAKLRFRHLPPEFITGLAAEQQTLTNVPKDALINPDKLLANLVVNDVVTATGGQDAQLACSGPQNDPNDTILACVKPVSGDGAVHFTKAAQKPTLTTTGITGMIHRPVPTGVALALLVVMSVWFARRPRRSAGTSS
jgi:hypothetical protein